MKTKQKRIQLVLISIGLLLILATYFYYPYIKKIKTVENQTTQKNTLTTPDSDHDTSFENVEYKGLYDLNKNFSVKSEKAHILNEEPDICPPALILNPEPDITIEAFPEPAVAEPLMKNDGEASVPPFHKAFSVIFQPTIEADVSCISNIVLPEPSYPCKP